MATQPGNLEQVPTASPGARVLIRWGLDLLPGYVIDRYNIGDRTHVVVRVDQETALQDEPLTVNVLDSDVFPAEDATDLNPAGTWVPGAIYERQVHHAIGRILFGSDPRPPVDSVSSEKDFDYVIRTSDSSVIVEVKFVPDDRQFTRKRADYAVRQLIRSSATAKIFVCNVIFPPLVSKYLRSHLIDPVTWNSPDDDEVLERSIRGALSAAGASSSGD